MAITFDNNGKFIATNIPEDLLSDQQDSKIRLFSGEGKWKFISIGGDDMLQLNFQDVSLKIIPKCLWVHNYI